MTDRERIDSLVKKTSDYADEIMELKQENSELKQRIAKLEKPKKKRKFRAMTNKNFCRKWRQHHLYCESSNDGYRCPQFGSKTCCKINENEPYKINGKYILVEVKQ